MGQSVERTSMKLGWYQISIAAVLLSLLSPSLWALDFDKEIAKQNSQVTVTYRQIATKIATKAYQGQRGQTPTLEKRVANDFNVELTPVKR